MKRRPCRTATVGPITLGDNHPIRVQSMTNVFTRDVDACVAQIDQMAQCGCELVRLAVPTAKDTAALPEILSQVSIPVVADVHFHYQRALEAIAAGVNKIRLNPGNIQDRDQVQEVIAACKDRNVAIRVGVNEGSVIERKDQQRRTEERQTDLVTLMVQKMAEYVRIFEDAQFDNLVLSAKTHDAAGCIAVNRALAAQFDYPIHLGVTHAGDVHTGTIRSAAALGALLSEGIGDTLRVSLAGDPTVELDVAWELLYSLGLRERRRPELIACPTCGRTEIDLIPMVERVRTALQGIEEHIVVAVMGCVVNGPGEADGADVALCGGRERALIFRHGEKVATVKADQAVDEMLRQVRLVLEEKNRVEG